MPRNDEYDWVFDFVLQFLESDKFDASVMNFLDEKCEVFDDEEENKFVYSTIHKEFCDHIEALIASNLGELGISNEMFVSACEKGRAGRDINTTVFERLIAMDDFQTFKKIMTKRNTELQLESIQSFKGKNPSPVKGFKERSENSKESDEAQYSNLEVDYEMEVLDEDMSELLFQSLMEMELIHRQEELEYAELERAMVMSLLIEEERLKLLTEGDDFGGEFGGEEDDYERSKRLTPPRKLLNEFRAADAKESSSASSSSPRETKSAESKPTSAPVATQSKVVSEEKPSAISATNLSTPSRLEGISDPKPLKGLRHDLKPLPSISAKPLPPISSSSASGLVAEFDEKKKATEDALKLGAQQLSAQRKQEEQFRKQANNFDPEEAERRARHMKEQRDLLIAKKKAEREKLVQIESERKAKQHADQQEVLQDSIERINAANSLDAKASGGGDAKVTVDMAELRRTTMRNALARRMKLDLIESEENKKAAQQEEQYSELDLQLRQVEQQREDNKKREYQLNKQLERQQAQIARNVKMSAAAMSRVDDDF